METKTLTQEELNKAFAIVEGHDVKVSVIGFPNYTTDEQINKVIQDMKNLVNYPSAEDRGACNSLNLCSSWLL